MAALPRASRTRTAEVHGLGLRGRGRSGGRTLRRPDEEAGLGSRGQQRCEVGGDHAPEASNQEGQAAHEEASEVATAEDLFKSHPGGEAS